MQSPSSLIFLALIGVWAAYFVQYWIRRRDHLATARSVEQFSAAIRVLERRAPIPRTDLSDPLPRSWAVHPARAARPQVVVKRAVPAEYQPVASRPAFADPGAAHRGSRPAAPRILPSRRVRAVVLLLALLGSLVTGGLVGLDVVRPWAVLVAVGGVLLALVWVRSAVRAEAAARAARRRRAQTLARRRASAPVAAAAASSAVVTAPVVPAAPEADGPAEDRESVPPQRSAGTDPLEVALAVGDSEVVGEVVEPEPEVEQVVEYVHLVDEDDIPLTWDPVPVPRPTYTMKAKAERPEVVPADVTPDAAPVALQDRAGPAERRAAAGA